MWRTCCHLGVTPGKKGQNRTKWLRLHPGDIVLLYCDKKIFCQARITLCLQNERLAKELWSVNSDGETWECVNFMDELQEIEISVQRFNEALNYVPTNIVQGFNVYGEEKAEALLSLLEIEPETVMDADLGSDDLESLKKRMAAIPQMDGSNASKRRMEKDLFRIYLGIKEGHKLKSCALCGRLLPVRLLVAAHIKRRASCTDDERRDFNVVMRACELGCDELFEWSHIWVGANGEIELAQAAGRLPDLKEYVQQLRGRICSAYNAETEQYFSWHRTHLRRFESCTPWP